MKLSIRKSLLGPIAGASEWVPGIIISPFARNSFVDHTEYETISILKLI